MFIYFFGGLERVGHSFVYVVHFVFVVSIRTHLTTHLPT
jgi:hypothetical protein